MDEFLKKLPKLAKESSKETAAYFAKLKKKPPKQLDYLMQDLHDTVFDTVDCLSCANCCKTTGPLFTRADIDRIAKHLKMKSAQLIYQASDVFLLRYYELETMNFCLLNPAHLP